MTLQKLNLQKEVGIVIIAKETSSQLETAIMYQAALGSVSLNTC